MPPVPHKKNKYQAIGSVELKITNRSIKRNIISLSLNIKLITFDLKSNLVSCTEHSNSSTQTFDLYHVMLSYRIRSSLARDENPTSKPMMILRNDYNGNDCTKLLLFEGQGPK